MVEFTIFMVLVAGMLITPIIFTEFEDTLFAKCIEFFYIGVLGVCFLVASIAAIGWAIKEVFAC